MQGDPSTTSAMRRLANRESGMEFLGAVFDEGGDASRGAVGARAPAGPPPLEANLELADGSLVSRCSFAEPGSLRFVPEAGSCEKQMSGRRGCARGAPGAFEVR